MLTVDVHQLQLKITDTIRRCSNTTDKGRGQGRGQPHGHDAAVWCRVGPASVVVVHSHSFSNTKDTASPSSSAFNVMVSSLEAHFRIFPRDTCQSYAHAHGVAIAHAARRAAACTLLGASRTRLRPSRMLRSQRNRSKPSDLRLSDTSATWEESMACEEQVPPDAARWRCTASAFRTTEPARCARPPLPWPSASPAHAPAW